MVFKLRLCLLILINCLIAPCLATPQIAVYHLEGLNNQQQSGSYDQLILKVKALGADLNLQFLPILRAKHRFNKGEIDCIAPSDDADSFFPFPTVHTIPFNKAKAYIFTRKEDGIISSFQELKGLKVGIRKGMNFSEEFDQVKKDIDLDIELVRDIEFNYKKLLAKRIDAFLAYTPDIWNLFGSRDIPGVIYDINYSLLTHPESIVCHDTPENRVLVTQFDAILKSLIKQGTAKEILGVSYSLD